MRGHNGVVITPDRAVAAVAVVVVVYRVLATPCLVHLGRNTDAEVVAVQQDGVGALLDKRPGQEAQLDGGSRGVSMGVVEATWLAKARTEVLLSPLLSPSSLLPLLLSPCWFPEYTF